MNNNQISLKIYSIIIEKILKIYNDYAKLILNNDLNRETEPYNFDFMYKKMTKEEFTKKL